MEKAAKKRMVANEVTVAGRVQVLSKPTAGMAAAGGKKIAEVARDLKNRYGLTPRSSAEAQSQRQDSSGEGGQASLDLTPAIRTFLDAVPAGTLTREQKQQLRGLVKELTAIIVRPRA